MQVNKNSKSILVYGDSYVFGKIPDGSRYDSETRFTGVMQKGLGENYEVIEEGLRGRTIDGENKFFPYRNGFPQFGPIFASHLPVDLLILFLGTNDINSGGEKIPEHVVSAYEKYLERIQWWCEHLGFKEPKIMLVAPPVIEETASYKLFKDIFKGSESNSRKLPKIMEKFAKSNGIEFFDSSKVVKVSKIDGVHLDDLNNKILGEELAKQIHLLI